ncbi:alkaline phosphatase D family protein [Nocardioides sp. AX2bis]|uniref:alkaline phosphatase D family protein n=1 Tax=Nocardioides sp. AX2bis TaxID=2653157 RepID=UPI0012EF883D|nr:alkaline phosphatase D family protein [Nocardioides sp. AX2bis]VXC12021.1 Phospholipase D [Nocardioides sp. AX2bis]
MTTPTRRTVLRTGAAGALGTAALAPGVLSPGAVAAPGARADRRTFAHGVASGDPLPRRVVIWTRVTPTPASTPGSGKGPQVTVRWEVARDAAFTRVVRRGNAVTGPSRDHTVKVDVDGLDADRWYHYRFVLDGRRSPVGRLRTAPRARAAVRRLRLGVVSCANWQAGMFAAYRGIAARDDLDAVLCLGDYLYEYAPGEYGYGNGNVDVRPHDPAREMVSLEDYRRRHAQYKTDPDLQAAHARYPWIVTWDDHETTNDAWRNGAENHQPDTEGDFKARRARAHRAYDEWMPVRMDGTARLGDGTRLYRRLTWGKLAEISMLDLRTYRSEQSSDPQAISDPARTITGKRQLAWLLDSLGRRASQWKVVGNPVMIAPVTLGALPTAKAQAVTEVTGLAPDEGVPINVDQWDGYTADRRQVFDHLRDLNIDDALFVTGDIHSAWAAELPFEKGTYPLSGTVGVEFVCSSVTSNNLDDITGGPEGSSAAVEATIKGANPHIKYLDFDRHGFSVLDITPVRAQMDWFVLGDRREADTTITHSASWLTRASSGTVEQAEGPAR